MDLNAYKLPRYPFAPLFHAAELMQPPAFRFDAIDLVINRNSLRNLLDFARGRTLKHPFRVNLFLVRDKTLVVERCTASAAQMIGGAHSSGYGHSFEDAFTTPPSGTEGSLGHHRVLRYKLGHLDCAVRFEVDACYHGPDDLASASASSSEENPVSSDGATTKADAGRSETPSALDFGSLSLQDDSVPAPAAKAASQNQRPPTSLVVLPRGAGTAQHHTAELKSGAKRASLPQTLPQLWFGRTPFLLSGCHTNGTFHRVDVTDAGAHFAAWETDPANQDGLRKMVSLLAWLREVARTARGGACVAVCDKGVKPYVLRVFEGKHGRSALPEEMIGAFWS